MDDPSASVEATRAIGRTGSRDSVPLDASAIARHLATGDQVRDVAAPGRRTPWETRVAAEVGSTNTELLREVKRGLVAPVRIVLAAETQRAGRGRLGRSWASVPGASITASFAIDIARDLARLDGVTLVCGLAIHRVIASTFDIPLTLKWPNDLLVDGRKLAGILVEAHPGASATTLVIGVGINVASTKSTSTNPAPTPFASLPALPPTDLGEQGAALVDRNRLIADLALSLEDLLSRFEQEGFAAFATAWNAADAFRDHRVSLESPPAPSVVGIARGVDDSGALLLEVDGRCRRIIAGDVSLRPVATRTAPA